MNSEGIWVRIEELYSEGEGDEALFFLFITIYDLIEDDNHWLINDFFGYVIKLDCHINTDVIVHMLNFKFIREKLPNWGDFVEKSIKTIIENESEEDAKELLNFYGR